MDQLYLTLRLVLAFISFSVILPTAHSQCEVDYTSYSYFCDLDSLILEAVPVSGTGPFTFIWETGETTQQILIPLAVGDYMVTMTDANGCTHIINCHIKPFPDVLYYPFNQNACEGDTVTLFLDWFRDSLPGATYLWSNGATTPTIELTDDLLWSVTVTDPANGCEYVIPPNLFEFHYTPFPMIVGAEMFCGTSSIELSVTGGPFGAIVWYPGALYQETLTVTEPGEYIVWTSAPTAGWCWHQDTINITTGNIPPPQITGPPDLCAGQSGTISITNALQYELFNWSNGQTTSSFSVNASGTYTVTVTNDSGCTDTASITVGSGGGPDLSIDETAATCGLSNGSIDLSVTPVQSNIYAWSNNATSQDLINISPGTYSVTVTDANGCTSTITTIVPDLPIVINITETITHNTSCTEDNGAIQISVMPTGTYAYAWSNGAVTEDIQNLAPGSYTVTVTTGVNCNATETYIIEDNSGAASLLPNITPTSCGESNGGIVVEPSGGQGPFQFLWSNGNTTSGISDVTSGTYSITVTGTDGCISTGTYTLPNNDPLITISGNVTPNTSCQSSNGSIDITVTPFDEYEYSWSNGSVAEDLTLLSAGTYSVTVTLGNTCMTSSSFTVTDANNSFTLSADAAPNTSCDIPNGSIDLMISPSGTYTYQWSTGSTQQDIFTLNAGTYEVTVTDASGCSIASIFEVVNNSASFQISGLEISNTSCDLPNGALDISVTPEGNYIFLWSTGAATEDLLEINGGLYTVTVTDENNCSSTANFNVTNEAVDFVVSAIPTFNTSCIEPNGSIDLTMSPVGNYTYQWSTNETSEDISFLDQGEYTVTVTDINSCSSTASFIIENSIENPLISYTAVHEACGASDGSIDLLITPSGSEILWSDGSVADDRLNLASGTYIVTVTSPNGCATSDTIVIQNMSNNFNLLLFATGNTSCQTMNGTIDLTINPAGNYLIQWSTGAVTEDIQGLAPGVYEVTVTDEVNCSSISSVTVADLTDSPILTEIITPASCGQSNGSIQVTIFPADALVQWSTGNTSADLSNISAGTYSITVTSVDGCLTTASFIVVDNNSSYAVTGTTIENNSCVSANGAIQLDVSPAGQYSFLWSNGAITEDIQNLDGGQYTVTVTDELNCETIINFDVATITSPPLISGIITPANCGQPDGGISLDVIPANGNSFIWSNSAITEDLTGLPANNYFVTVTDVNGCTSSANFIVPNQSVDYSITANTTSDNSCMEPNGTIDITMDPPGSFAFIWSNGETTEDLENLAAGIYTLTVTDVAQCSSTIELVIDDSATEPMLSYITTPSTCGQPNGTIDLSIVNITVYTYSWSNGSSLEDQDNLGAGIYTVTVTSEMGCKTTSSIEVLNENINFNISAVTIPDTSCAFATGAINLTVSTPGIYQYAWSTGESTEDLTNMPSGIYEVTVTNIENCSSSLQVEIENTAPILLIGGITKNATCGDENGSIDITVSPSHDLTYAWSNGSVAEDLVPVRPGSYAVTVTDAGGCSATENFTVGDSPSLSIDLQANLTAVNAGDEVTCSLEINLSTAAIDHIVWSPGELMSCTGNMCMEQRFTVTETIEVGVTVFDTFGCNAGAFLILDVNAENRVFIPNVFSPNGDGTNDWFTVYTNEEVEEVVVLEIFNRWGDLVFANETFPPNEENYGWDGIYRGKMMNPDVFAYRAVVKYGNGELHNFKGDVTLVR